MKPRERMALLGVESLNDAELIAILLRTGTKDESVVEFSDSIIRKFGGLSSLLESNLNELKKIKGLGNAKSSTLSAVMELAKRYYMSKLIENNFKFTSPNDTFNYLKTRITHDGSEHFCVLFLNNSNQLIEFKEMFKGNNRQAPVFISEILRYALKVNASSIIASHNHPSGNITPSEEDIKLTEKLSTACNIIGINLLDHIIFSSTGHTSLSEIGLIWLITQLIWV